MNATQSSASQSQMTEQHDYRAKLRPFYEAIAAQRDDSIAAANAGVELFIDSGDVIIAALGMMQFATADKSFDAAAFAKPRVLACCLLSRGWAGSFKMFSPHEAEFLSNLNLDFGLSGRISLRQNAEEFLKAVKVQIETGTDSSDAEARITDEIPGYLRSQAASAPLLFKAVECVRGSWQTRLARWRVDQLLTFSEKSARYHLIFEDPLFESLREYYGRFRPNTRSNEVDAAALVMLSHRIRNYNANPERLSLPRFFSGDRYLRRVIHAARAGEAFSYRSPADGRMRSAICDVNYFEFRASFLPPPGRGSDIIESREELRSIFDQISEIIRGDSPATREYIEQISVRGRPLLEVIEELGRFTFLSTVWVSELRDNYVKQVVAELDAAALQLEDSAKQKQLQETLSTIRANLASGASEFKLATKLWEGIPVQASKLRERLKTDDDLARVVRQFGLIRFSFVKDAEPEIEKWLVGLLEGESESLRVRTHVVQSLIHSSVDDEQSPIGRTVVASILWVLGYYKELADIQWSAESSHHFSLDLVSAAAMRRTDYALLKADSLLADLQRRYATSADPGLAVGIAYLIFQKWRKAAHSVPQTGPTMPPASTPQIESSRAEAKILVDRAIDFAKNAYRSLAEDDPRKLYALNQYLYYLAEGAELSRMNEMVEAAEHLAASRRHSAWQYRYDDTLARHYYRLALASKNGADRAAYAGSAWEYIETAWSESRSLDHEVSDFREVLKQALLKWRSR